jgi:hypothetical protein
MNEVEEHYQYYIKNFIDLLKSTWVLGAANGNDVDSVRRLAEAVAENLETMMTSSPGNTNKNVQLGEEKVDMLDFVIT